MKNILSIVLILISLVIFGMRIAKSVEFKRNVSGLLKRAAAANTIQLADEELSKAIQYLEKNKMTSGYTSILYETPDEDIDFWYRNLKASQNELQTLNSDSALEKANVLIKLRETIIGKSRVTVPDGLSVYPNNKFWAFLMSIAILAGFIGIMIPVIESDRKAREKAKNGIS